MTWTQACLWGHLFVYVSFCSTEAIGMYDAGELNDPAGRFESKSDERRLLCRCVLCTTKNRSLCIVYRVLKRADQWLLLPSSIESWSANSGADHLEILTSKKVDQQIRVMIVNKQIARAPPNATSITSDKILLSSAGWSTLYCEIRGRDTLVPSMCGRAGGKQFVARQKSKMGCFVCRAEAQFM